MSAGERWPLRQAIVQAKALVDLLEPYCLRIEVAGSIRRQRPDVGDVEIVLLPRLEERPAPAQIGLLDEPRTEVVSLAWEQLDRLAAEGALPARSKGGERYRCYPAVPGRSLQVDVFSVADPRGWGVILGIRTGPAEFSKAMAGWRLRQLRREMRGGLVWEGGKVLPCPEEADFFRACGVPWTSPRDRR